METSTNIVQLVFKQDGEDKHHTEGVLLNGVPIADVRYLTREVSPDEVIVTMQFPAIVKTTVKL